MDENWNETKICTTYFYDIITISEFIIRNVLYESFCDLSDHICLIYFRNINHRVSIYKWKFFTACIIKFYRRAEYSRFSGFIYTFVTGCALRKQNHVVGGPKRLRWARILKWKSLKNRLKIADRFSVKRAISVSSGKYFPGTTAFEFIFHFAISLPCQNIDVYFNFTFNFTCFTGRRVDKSPLKGIASKYFRDR